MERSGAPLVACDRLEVGQLLRAGGRLEGRAVRIGVRTSGVSGRYRTGEPRNRGPLPLEKRPPCALRTFERVRTGNPSGASDAWRGSPIKTALPVSGRPGPLVRTDRRGREPTGGPDRAGSDRSGPPSLAPLFGALAPLFGILAPLFGAPFTQPAGITLFLRGRSLLI